MEKRMIVTIGFLLSFAGVMIAHYFNLSWIFILGLVGLALNFIATDKMLKEIKVKEV